MQVAVSDEMVPEAHVNWHTVPWATVVSDAQLSDISGVENVGTVQSANKCREINKMYLTYEDMVTFD